MHFQIEHAVEILSRTPATLTGLVGGLPADWVINDEGPDTWSPFDVVGHLIHGEETDRIPRARIILEHGESCAFDPFDRQIVRVMSKQYSEEVGPWQAYLSILTAR
ncbi:MAG TPA: hypothetical protein VJH03_20320 [Blastocatellia bacterium]|nr:hypothetical protein [Blastocatellia bacterium]